MGQLGLTSWRLPASLNELGSSPLFAAAERGQQFDPAELAAYLQQARTHPVTELDWGVVFAAAKSGRLQQHGASQLVSLLSWAAKSSRQQLQGPGNPQGAAASGTAAAQGGDPRLQQALQRTLNLSVFFLSCFAKGEGVAATAETRQVQGKAGGQKGRGGGGGGGDTAATAAAALTLRRDALLALSGVEEAMWSSRTILPAVSDLQAADRLIRGTAMHCLLHPLGAGGGAGVGGGGGGGGDRSRKALAESSFQALAGILSRPLVMAEERQAHAAAGATLRDLLGVVEEPKQQAQVLSAAVRLVTLVMQQSSRAGATFVSHLAERVQSLAAASGGDKGVAAAATATGQQLDACLHFTGMLAASGSTQLQAALLLCLPQLLPLASASRSSTRRLVLDVCSSLLAPAGQLPHAAPPAGTTITTAAAVPEMPAAVGPAACAAGVYQAVLLSALVSRLSDRDATLRAKALGILEKHARVLVAQLAQGSASGAGSSSLGSALLPAMVGRLCDKSPSVRKRAIALLTALLDHARLAAPAGTLLADALLPVASKLLGVRADSALHPGEEGVKALSQAVLRMAGSSRSTAGILHLLQLASSSGGEAARQQLQEAVVGMLLPSEALSAAAAVAHGQGREAAIVLAGDALLCSLGQVLGQCSSQQVVLLRRLLQHSIAAGSMASGTAAAVSAAVQLCYRRLHAAQEYSQAAEHGPGAPDGAAECSSKEAAAGKASMAVTAAALSVLGPFSSQDPGMRLAEAGLLLTMLQQLAHPESTAVAAEASECIRWLLEAFREGAASLQLDPSSSMTSSQAAADMPDGDAQLAEAASEQVAAEKQRLAQASLASLLAVLLSPACTAAVRQAALGAALALPAAAKLPLRLLRALEAAAASGNIQQLPKEGSWGTAVLRMAVDEESGELQLVGSACSRKEAGDKPAGAEAGSKAVAATAAAAPGSVQQQEEAEEGQGHKAQVQLQALVGLLELLGGMAGGYIDQRTAFLQQLQQGQGEGPGQQQQQGQGQHKSKAGRPLRPAADWWVGNSGPAEGSAPGGIAGTASVAEPAIDPSSSSGGGGANFDYMQSEEEAAKHEAAAQRFLDSLLLAADTAPACYLPLLERLAGSSALPSVVQAAALAALGKLAVLSEPLCLKAVALAESCLLQTPIGSRGRSAAAVQQAAVVLLADAIDAYPNTFSSKLLLIGQLMVPQASQAPEATRHDQQQSHLEAQPSLTSAAVSGGSSQAEAAPAQHSGSAAAAGVEAPPPTDPTSEQQHAHVLALEHAASGTYCRLLLRNKLKLQGMLGPLGSALTAGSPGVVAVVRHALRQLLGAAAPKERCRLALDLFHQTPLSHRLQLAQDLVAPASGLLSEADLRGDLLVSQALQALLAAAGGQAAGPTGASAAAGGADQGDSVAAAACLLRSLHPSAKVLATLSTQLQPGGGSGTAAGTTGMLGKLPLAARQALREFVSNHVPAAAGRGDLGAAELAGTAAGAAARTAGTSSAAAAGGVSASAGDGAAHKRKRAAAGSAAKGGGSAALQRQLLHLLESSGSGGGRGRAGAGGLMQSSRQVTYQQRPGLSTQARSYAGR